MIPLSDVTPSALNNVTTQFILLHMARANKEPGLGAATCLALVADETAAVHFQFWGSECDSFRPGDIIRLTNGIFSYSGNRNALVLRAGKRGRIEKVGEFTMNYVETPNISEIKWVPEGASGRYVPESVVSPYSRIFPPLR
ncbi:hypothetical protein MLD38_026966 [Melastoma candidum]|uniref:Uncharacterized protein n=1 Tax=Melastoma candidum TaxID=119954 RepID=A0ACB9P091_9MYRT|nr:hypothetical protein MLD38_026966 [Melastoma candidum]